MSLGAALPGRSMAARGSLVLSHHTANGLNPKPRLYVGGGVLFLRVHVEQGGVEVPDHRAGRWLRRPHARPGGGQSDRDRPQLEDGGGVHGPPGRGDRRHRAEEILLFFEGGHVGQAVRPVGDGDGQMGEHDTGIVGVPGDPAVVHGHRHGLGQPAAIGQFGQAARHRHG